MIKWIKKKLGVSDLEKRVDELEIENRRKDKQITSMSNHIKGLQNLYNVAIDASPSEYDKSWAIVCLGGKMERVSFFEMEPNQIRTIQNFLRQFENAGVSRRQILIDAPPSMKKWRFFE